MRCDVPCSVLVDAAYDSVVWHGMACVLDGGRRGGRSGVGEGIDVVPRLGAHGGRRREWGVGSGEERGGRREEEGVLACAGRGHERPRSRSRPHW